MEVSPEGGGVIGNGDGEAGLLVVEEIVLSHPEKDIIIGLENVLSQRKDQYIRVCINEHCCLKLVLRKVSQERSVVHQHEYISDRKVGVSDDVGRQVDIEAVSQIGGLISLHDSDEGLILISDQVASGINLLDLLDDCAEEDAVASLVAGGVADVVIHSCGLKHLLVDHHVAAHEGIVVEDKQVEVGKKANEGSLEVASDGSS